MYQVQFVSAVSEVLTVIGLVSVVSVLGGETTIICQWCIKANLSVKYRILFCQWCIKFDVSVFSAANQVWYVSDVLSLTVSVVSDEQSMICQC